MFRSDFVRKTKTKNKYWSRSSEQAIAQNFNFCITRGKNKPIFHHFVSKTDNISSFINTINFWKKYPRLRCFDLQFMWRRVSKRKIVTTAVRHFMKNRVMHISSNCGRFSHPFAFSDWHISLTIKILTDLGSQEDFRTHRLYHKFAKLTERLLRGAQ